MEKGNGKGGEKKRGIKGKGGKDGKGIGNANGVSE